MTTEQLVEIIGEPRGSIIIAGKYGNATLHAKGFWSCDPCYLHFKDESGLELGDQIREAYHAQYPWDGYDYTLHHHEWCEFEFKGQKLWARDHEDGVGYFGNCIDAGWIVVFPFDIAPQSMKDKASVRDSQ